jgi:hypothetical protein
MTATQNYSSVALSTAMLPSEGPKVIPQALDFSIQASFPIDLQGLQSRNVFSAVQSVFVDNSANAQNLTLTFEGTGQTIICKAHTQGYYTVLVPNPARFTAASTGGARAYLIMINAPVAGAVWSTV